MAHRIVPEEMGKARIASEEFVRLHNANQALLVDIRVPAETAVWQINIGLRIPAGELPRDKLLVVAPVH